MAEQRAQASDQSHVLGTALGKEFRRVGCRYAFAPAEVSEGLFQEVVRQRDLGLLSQDLFTTYQDYWQFETPEGVAEPRTLIVAVWASLPLRLRFQFEEGPFDAVVPPTYISAAERSRFVEAARSVLIDRGYGVGWARVPAKLLAVRVGLMQYGRNNVAYAPGLGSYARLGVLCTDADLLAPGARVRTATLPFDRPLAFMERCTRCRACVHACPTGCIPEEGTVIDASHCLSAVNENKGDWPLWVPVAAHNSLVGCMACQEACPVNRVHRGTEPELVAEFSADETSVILEDRTPEALPLALRSRLAAIDLDEYSSVLGRNLRALREASSARSGR